MDLTALLSYRSFGCCRHIYKKLFHTVSDRRSFCRESFLYFSRHVFFFFLYPPGVPHFGRAGHRHGFHHRVGFSQLERSSHRQLLEPPFMDGSHDHGIIRHTGSQNGNRVSVLQIIKIATLLTATHRRPKKNHHHRLLFFVLILPFSKFTKQLVIGSFLFCYFFKHDSLMSFVTRCLHHFTH